MKSAPQKTTRGQKPQRRPAMGVIAIDLASKKSQVCERNSRGEILFEKALPTIELVSEMMKREPTQIIMETCTQAFHIARQLKKKHEVKVIPAHIVPQLGVGLRSLKTDQRDARALSQAGLIVTLQGVHIPSEKQAETRRKLRTRTMLVRQRTAAINKVKAHYRGQLELIEGGTPEKFPERMSERNDLPSDIACVLAVINVLNEQIKKLTDEIEKNATADKVIQKLMTVPGIGPITATAFRTAVDDVKRFNTAGQVANYFGLTPGENSSGDTLRKTRITKAGAEEVRAALIESAHSLMNHQPNSPLGAWGHRLKEKKGTCKAATAVARKLACICFAIFRDGTSYNPKRAAKEIETKINIEKVAKKIWPKLKTKKTTA